MVREVGNLAKVARDLDLTETALRSWVKQADIDQGKGPEGALTTEKLRELRRLRRENRILKMERDFAKKAAAFFAKDLDPPSS
jgi:transposase